jgi:phage FluMu protein gp41
MNVKTIQGVLPHGLSISGTLHQAFTLREVSVGDMLDAEADADVTRPLTFAAHLLLRQLVRVGSFEGPFTINMIRSLKPTDFRALREKQAELDAQGEDVGSEG